MAGFLAESKIQSQRPLPTLPQCGACGLFKNCETPKMEVSGKGKKHILIVGEYPSEEDDLNGSPFADKSGRRLASELKAVGIDMRRDCWLTNAVICNPQGNLGELHITSCLPNIIKAIEQYNPKVIILLGSAAANAVLGYAWGDSPGGIVRWQGRQIPSRNPNAWICPTFDPAFVVQSSKDAAGSMISEIFRKDLLKAAKLANKGKRPWEKIPDERKDVEVILDPREAARTIRQCMVHHPGLSSFDYETNMLKPDGEDAEIVSCAICFEGVRTIAYPWQGKAIDATVSYLKSTMRKGGANIKFEERWTRAKLGIRVRNWVWDSMQAAHVIDHRRGVTSVKFQAFALLGTPIYNKHIVPYLESEGPSVPNRIREIDIEDLLTYNGMDSILEYKIAMKQAKRLRMTLG